jgi:hypothetical protein
VNEGAFPSMSLCFALIYIAPSQARNNCIAYFLGWVYYLFRLHADRGMLKIPFIMSTQVSVMYFIMASVISYLNLKNLNKQVYVNQQHAKEIKRLLKMFPHGVLIQSGDKENNFKVDFTNRVFNRQIREIRNKVEELQKIDVIEDDEEVKMNLHEFLVSKQAKLVNDKVLEQKKLTIKSRNS